MIGSLWGASEIVLGSFLHNLKIPFSGNLLTSIGIVIMIAGHRLWPERGIIIRAGLICAALKTLSPSASIMGPMMAITMQATLMEIALLIGRGTWFGYLLGGGLAMSWNIFHRIFTSIVLYGGTLIELYKSLIDYFIRQTGWQVEGYLAPLLLLASIFFVTGMAAATAGIYISKLAQKVRDRDAGMSLLLSPPSDTGYHNLQSNKAEAEVKVKVEAEKNSKWITKGGEKSGKEINLPGYVVLMRIVVIIVLLVGAMMGITRLPLAIAAAILAIYLFAIWRYDIRLLARFIYRKGFWISMGIMLLLSALLLKQDQGDSTFSLDGLQAGVEMIMRAMYVITGFGLLSKELRSKSLVSWFEHMHMKGFLDAMRLSFQATPLLIENIPGKKAWKRPTMVLSTMIASMEDAYDQMRQGDGARGRGGDGARGRQGDTFIITGTRGSGKSTLLAAVVDELKQRGVQVHGILAPELVENGERIGYYVQDADTGERMVLCKKEGESERGSEGVIKGRYMFDKEAIAFGEKLLSFNRKERQVMRRGHEEKRGNFLTKLFSLRSSRITPRPLRLKKIMVIDELGPFELKGQGWARAMDKLQQYCQGPMIWVVRESLIDDMLQRWPVNDYTIIRAGDQKPQEIIDLLRQI